MEVYLFTILSLLELHYVLYSNELEIEYYKKNHSLCLKNEPALQKPLAQVVFICP